MPFLPNSLGTIREIVSLIIQLVHQLIDDGSSSTYLPPFGPELEG